MLLCIGNTLLFITIYYYYCEYVAIFGYLGIFVNIKLKYSGNIENRLKHGVRYRESGTYLK